MTNEASTSAPVQPFPPQAAEWLRFWKIFFLTTIVPILIFAGALEWLGWSVGETYTPEALIRALDQHPDLVWMGERIQAHARLKLAQVAEQRPEVLIMGESRLGKVQASMFRPYTFYNLARVSWPFDTFTGLLRHFPEGYRPKVIIFSVDFFMLGPKFTAHYAYFDMAPVYGHAFSEHLLELEDVAHEVVQYPELVWKRTDYNHHPARGISAIMGGEAFRKDGSEQAPLLAFVSAGRSPAHLMRPTWKDFVTGGQKMGDVEMSQLKEFVDLGHKMGIPMVGVQMPMYGPAVRELEKDPNYRILQDFRDHVARGYFDRLGILFFDYMNFPPYSEDYRYFYDAVHPGAPLTAAVILAMASDPRFHALLPRLDMEELRRKLKVDKDEPHHLFLPQ